MMTAILAMAFYALEITITDLKLGHVPAQLLTFLYASGVAIFALVNMLSHKETLTMPNAATWGFVATMVFVSFVASSAHFQALHDGIGTAKLTIAYAFLPVVGAVYVALLKKEMPSVNLILACVLAGISLYLVSKIQNGSTAV
ncbi:MAG: EamA family transporter [Candidatus Peribacteraceae bacterium]